MISHNAVHFAVLHAFLVSSSSRLRSSSYSYFIEMFYYRSHIINTCTPTSVRRWMQWTPKSINHLWGYNLTNYKVVAPLQRIFALPGSSLQYVRKIDLNCDTHKEKMCLKDSAPANVIELRCRSHSYCYRFRSLDNSRVLSVSVQI